MSLEKEDKDLIVSLLRDYKNRLAPEENAETIQKIDQTVDELLGVKNIASSSMNFKALGNAGITVQQLDLDEEKVPELESLGRVEDLGLLTKKIELIRAHVSLATQAGCQMLIDALILFVASSLNVGNIIEHPVAVAINLFEKANATVGGILDFLVIKGREKSMINFVLNASESTNLTGAFKGEAIASTVYEAKKNPNDLRKSIPQAAMAVASYCRQHGLLVSRGCVSSGEGWVFFAYVANAFGEGGVVHYSPEFLLKEDLSGILLILGILKDWVTNANDSKQRFFHSSTTPT